MRELKFLLKDSIIYGGANAISKLFSLFTLPLIARYFGVEKFGIYDYFMVLSGFITILFVFGQDSAVARYLFETEIVLEKKEIISQSLLIQTVGIILLVPVLYVNVGVINSILFGHNVDNIMLIKIALFQIPFLVLINFTQNIFKWTFKRNLFLVITLGYTIINAASLIIAINVMGAGLNEIFIINLICNIIFGVFGLFFIRNWLIIPRNFNHLKRLVPYAIPIAIICIVGGVMPVFERTLILKILGQSELSQYSMGYKIAMLLSLLIISFQTAWGPFAFSNFKSENVSELFSLVLKIFVIIICVLTLILETFKNVAIDIFAGHEFDRASTIIFPLAMGIAIHAISSITEIGISISKKSHLNIYAYLTDVIITGVGFIVLGCKFGIYGISIAFLLGKITKAVLSTYFSIEMFKINWDLGGNIKVIFLTLICGFSSRTIEDQYGKLNYFMFITFFILVILLYFWRRLLKQEDRSLLINYMNEIRGIKL